MSGLFALLSRGAMSLQTQSAYSSTVAHNLSNSNTPGYARQRAEISAALPADRVGNSFIGGGAALQGITQARDRFLEAQMPAAISQEASSSTESQTLQAVTALDLDNSVAPALSNFYAQMRALAQNPGSPNYRTAAVSAAQQLALTFNRTANAIEAARTGVDDKLQADLPELNQSLQQIATLNSKIRQNSAAGASPNDLLDARQKLADRVAQLTGATPVANGEGDLNLTLADGTALVAKDKASTFSVLPDAANNGHFRLYVQKPDGSPAAPVAGTPGGELGGLIKARDGALKTAGASIDQLAFDFSTSVNTISQAGVGLDGSGGRDLFTVTATASGAAKSMTLNTDIAADPNLFPAGTTSSTGDATNVQAMINTESTVLSSGATASGTLSAITTAFGAATQRAKSANEADTAMLGNLTSMRDSVSGVSVDEELVNMQKAQRGYEAVSKVIKAADAMLETLMGLK